jgi:cysteinyl-tRNA synthetase
MSKSKGEFLTVSLLEEKGYNPLVYRMFCLQSHYRKPLEFSYEVMDNVAAAYNKLVKRIAALKNEGEVDKASFDMWRAKFEDAIVNDMNTSMGITVIYDMLKADINDATKLALIESFDYVLSLDLLKAAAAVADGADNSGEAVKVDAELEAYILAMIEERKAAKKEKNFARADEIRNELLEKGIALEDTREGVKWKLV